MKLTLTLFGEDREREEEQTLQLQEVIRALADSSIQDQIQIQKGSVAGEPGQVILLDDSLTEEEGASILQRIDRRGRVVFWVAEEGSRIPELYAQKKVDDLITKPYRTLEVLSKLHQYERMLLWNEIGEINTTFSEIMKGLQEDLGLAERLQKSRLPKRFGEIRGFTVLSRYLAGMRSGGDHFDLAETKDKSHFSIFLTRSSSFGLSTAVLSALMRVAMKVSLDQLGQVGAITEMIRRIHDDLLLTIGEKDQLSFFYGTLSRKDSVLRFINLGSSTAFFAAPNQEFKQLPKQGEALSQTSGYSPSKEYEMSLMQGSRLVLSSSGFTDALGGAEEVRKLLNPLRNQPVVDSLNELAFKVKSKLKGDDDMPTQDCTAIILEPDAQVFRLPSQV